MKHYYRRNGNLTAASLKALLYRMVEPQFNEDYGRRDFEREWKEVAAAGIFTPENLMKAQAKLEAKGIAWASEPEPAPPPPRAASRTAGLSDYEGWMQLARLVEDPDVVPNIPPTLRAAIAAEFERRAAA